MHTANRTGVIELNERLIELSTTLIRCITRMLKENTLPPPYNIRREPYPGTKRLFNWILNQCRVDCILEHVEEGKYNEFDKTSLYVTAHRLTCAAQTLGLIVGLPEAREWLQFEQEYKPLRRQIGDPLMWPDP